MKMTAFSRIACVQAFASMLLISGCGGGDSTADDIADNDCTPTTNVSTTLLTQVDINGNVSLVPVSNNTVSGCASSPESDGTIELSDSVTTRFESSEDYDVWECDTESGTNIYYTLFDKWNSSYQRYGLEIGPIDSPRPVSQSVLWEASNADTLLLRIPEQGTAIEWTSIRFPSADTMNANSATRGTLQCTLKSVNENSDNLFGFDVVISSLAAGSDGTVELTSRIQTDYATLVNLQFWQCLAEDGSLLRYTFFDRDFPDAPSRDEFGYYGLYWPTENDYFWRATSADSLSLEPNTQGSKVEWTDVRFPDRDHLTANSSSDGMLSCFLMNFGI